MTDWKPGDEANGHRLNNQGQWIPIRSLPGSPRARQLSPDGRFWWDGRQWLSTGGGPGEQLNHQSPAPKKRTWPRWVGGAVALFFIILMLGQWLDTREAGKVVSQDQFVAAIVAGRYQATEASNELQVVQSRQTRSSALCELLPSNLRVNDWVGSVTGVSTKVGGDAAVLELSLAEGIDVETSAGTAIAASSELFNTVSKLTEGDVVKFSGYFVRDDDNCIREQSLLDLNGMKTPTFSFSFLTVTASG